MEVLGGHRRDPVCGAHGVVGFRSWSLEVLVLALFGAVVVVVSPKLVVGGGGGWQSGLSGLCMC